MMNERYEQQACTMCGGTGQRHDATNADKVCTGGAGAVKCSRCNGAGVRSVLVPSAELVAYRERERAELQALHAEVGEMPEWMMG